ncbi:sporulation histidine kinase inhibitor Sda [Bacillus sp. FJAT-49732]|uniref:Sporulation histidine kinase inhibitor Sda n=1 Tax=Lederbergia citrisecunda TaxID=2833583 RepID=A0A942TL95_9BACI|nr:sporulation histidine kinase inhibitor Sda [Lederbergia citrisecunda]
MKEMSNELLISLFRKAKCNKLDHNLIKLLHDEIKRRKIYPPL